MIAPSAVKDMLSARIPASLTIAQAILESSWGSSELAIKANNLFGIKGIGPAGSYRKLSPEYINEKKESDFKKYYSWDESIRDHTDFLLKPRYAKVLGADWRKACQEVYDAGYATDPAYPQKLIRIIEQNKLYEYDSQGVSDMTRPVLIIDPGHGGADPGAIGNGMKEKDINLQISLYQYARFQALGVPVALTRTTDVTLSPEQRTKIVRDSGATYCISNHINAGGGDGAETIYSIHSDGKLAHQIADYLKESGQNLRRVFTRQGKPNYDYYFMHRETGKVETVIVEYAFIDSKRDDAEQIKRDWKIWAESVVKSFCDFIGFPYKSDNPQPESKSVDKVGIIINGVRLPANGYLEDKVSYLPVRAVSESMGVTPVYEPHSKQVTINGYDLTETIAEGVAFAPAREIAEALGLQVEWDQESKTVKLQKGCVCK